MDITEKNLHTKIKTVEKSGNDQVIKILYPTNYDSDVLLTDHKNTNIPSSAVTVKDVIDSVGSLAFKSSINNATTSSSGLMSATDKQKVDMIDLSTGAVGTITSVQVNGTSIASKGVANIPLANGTKTAGAILTTSTVTSATGYTASPVINGVPYYKDTITTYDDATQSKHGLMTAADKTKLDGIATGANKITIDSALSSSSTNPVQNKVITSANGVSTLLNQLTIGKDTPVDDDYFISQYVGGGTTTTTYHRRSVSALANYIKSKITIPTSLKNPHALVVKFNGGTTEGTNMFTYDGSVAKSINITPSSIGAAASSHIHNDYYGTNESRTANTVLAAPDGSNGSASFRKLTMNDIPRNYLHYYSSSMYTKGYYKIKIKSLANWMLSIYVRIYQKYQNTDLVISGYNYYTAKEHWYSPKATILGSSLDSMQIVFGYDADDYLWFTIPASDYSGIDIVDVVSGFNNPINNFNKLFEITYIETEPTTAQSRVTAYCPYNATNFILKSKVSDVTTLGYVPNGYTEKIIPTINTLTYWNGAYTNSGNTYSSNIEYTKVGKLGSAATLSSDNLISSASISKNVITFTKANSTTNTVTVTLPMLKGATTSDDGSLGFVPTPTKSDVNKFLKGDGTWTAIAIPTIPTSLKNPNAITIKLNGGKTEVYDGSTAKSIDITPSSISAATSTHAHGNITNDGKVGTAANKVLTTSTGGAIVASDEGTAFNKNFETSTSNIKANGTVSVGTATTVARADHVHPTDTTRAKAADLTKHTSDTTAHITADERATWNAKQNALESGTDYLTPTVISSTYLKKNPDGTNNLIGTNNKINSTYLPTYTASSVGLGNVTNNKQVKGLSTGTTENHVITWGADGYTVKDSGFTIDANVPSGAKFTDTTSTLVVGSKNSSSTNESVSSNSIYLNLFNGSTMANSHNIVGTGATTVSADVSGKITINSPVVTLSSIGAAPSSHSHTKSQIEDFPTSMPASDVSAWAKATTKPSYVWSEIGSKPTGDASTLGITKLYTSTGNGTDGTITQQKLTELFNDVNDDLNTAIDSVIDTINKKQNENDEELDKYATIEYVDGEDTKLRTDITNKYDLLSAKDDEIIQMIKDTNDSLDISDYIRFVDGLLEMGYSTNTYIQKNDNNKIAFYQGDTIIASIHDNKIESNNVKVTNSIIIGDDTNGFFELSMDSTAGLVMR